MRLAKFKGPLQKVYLKIMLVHLGHGCQLLDKVIINRPHLVWVGNHVTFRHAITLYAHPRSRNHEGPLITICDGAHIGDRCFISAETKVVIGKKVLLAPNVLIQDNTHVYSDIGVPVMDQPVTSAKPIEVGSGTWVGYNAAIISGASIGKNCVIGANSVVNTVIPDYCVAVGAPARIVKYFDAERGQWVKGFPSQAENHVF